MGDLTKDITFTKYKVYGDAIEDEETPEIKTVVRPSCQITKDVKAVLRKVRFIVVQSSRSHNLSL